MTEIFVMTRDHEFWEKTAVLAEHCSWRASSRLAQKMRGNDFAEWERMFAAVKDGDVAGFCTHEGSGVSGTDRKIGTLYKGATAKSTRALWGLPPRRKWYGRNEVRPRGTRNEHIFHLCKVSSEGFSPPQSPRNPLCLSRFFRRISRFHRNLAWPSRFIKMSLRVYQDNQP